MLQLHLELHYLELLGPLNPHLHQAPIQIPSLHSEVYQSCHTESQYTPSICSLSLLVLSTVFLSHPLVPHLYSYSFSFSSTVQPLHTLNLVELFDLILLTCCTHFLTIFLLPDLFLFSVRYLGANMFFCLPLYSCSSTSFSLASSPLWLSLSMVFWQLFLSSIPHSLQHFSLLPLLNSPIFPLLFPV